MDWLVYGSGVLLIGGLLSMLFIFDGWRYIQTAALILRVAPYEQPGGGAGSIYVIGDSTGYGTGATRAARSVAGQLGEEYSWYTITNDSKNSRTIAGAQNAAASLRGKHDLVLLQIGANDLLAGRAVDTVVADMRSLINDIRPHAAAIVVMTAGNLGALPIYADQTAQTLQQSSVQYDTAMRQLATEFHTVSYVSLYTEPADDPFVQAPEVYLAADGLHPSDDGYRYWYQQAAPYLAAHLSKK